jgi:hypothetical protein
MPDPAPATAERLLVIVRVWRQLVSELNKRGELSDPTLTGALVHGVLVEGGHLDVEPPWATRPIVRLLQELVDGDSHLRATCLNPFHLAQALEHFLDPHIQIFLSHGPEVDAQLVDFLLDGMYRGEYLRRLYLRLYNVAVEEPPVVLDGFPARIEVLDRQQISPITGETTYFSALHREGTGNAFLVFEDDGHGDDIEWWQRQWLLAWPVLQAMRYVKYAVIDIDYGSLHYEPAWVNQVRRPGVGISGHPRSEKQEQSYVLTIDDQRRLRRYLTLMKQHEALLLDLTPPLRRALLTAGDYYEGHHARGGLPEKLIALVIALEALFGDRRTDLAFRISMAVAVLIGKTTAEIADIFDFVRRMYGARSDLVHGAQNPFDPIKEKDRVTSADLARLGDLVRQVVVRVAVLLLRGDYNRQRDPFLTDLLRASFDAELREKIQSRTDVDGLLGEEPEAGRPVVE